MNKLLRGALLAAIATAVALMTAMPALAAPVAWKGVDVTVHYEQNMPIVLVTGYLPDNATLPASVELAVPSGQFSWAGEILGGDPSADPSVQYTVRQDQGMDIYSFTLTKARIGQVEVAVPSAITFDGTAYRSAVKWTAVTDVPEVNLYVRVPNGTQVTEPADGAQMTPGATGFSYYTRAEKDVKAGTPLDLTFAYTAPAQPAGGAAPASQPSQNGLPMALLLVLVGGALAMVFVGVKGKMTERRTHAEDDAFDEDETKPGGTRPAAMATDESFDVDEPEQPVARQRKSTAARSEATPQPAPKPASKAPLVVGVVVVGIVIAGFAAAGSGTASQAYGGTVVKDFGNQSACASTQVGLTTDDPEKVFAALEGDAGLGKVTVDPAAKTAYIEFCVSSTTEQAVLAKLSSAGVLGQAAPSSAPTTAPATWAPASEATTTAP